MDVFEKIRQLASLMSEQDLIELEVEEPDLRIKIKTSAFAQSPHPSAGGVHHVPVHATAGASSTEAAEELAAADEDLLEITAPMVGTFYRAPSEGSEPYVTVGSIVDPDTVVCIVEAMKVMNEVKAEVSGEIVEILVQNAEPVEFGQVLFLVRPVEE